MKLLSINVKFKSATNSIRHQCIFTIILLLTVYPYVLLAQNNFVFGPNVKVNDDPGGQAFHTVYSYGAHTIAARGDTVYIAYRGDQTGLSSVYFSKSIDCGQTWTPGLRVNYPNHGIIQSLAVDAKGDIFIAYTHIRDPNYRDIHFTKSTDGGLTFTYPIRLEDDTLPNQNGPSIAVDTSGQKIFVAWNDYRNFSVSGIDIYLTRSTDGGASFLPNIRVDDTGNDSSWQRGPGIAVDRGGNNVYVAWYDERNWSKGSDIYFSRSTDGGLSFLPNVLVNDTATTESTNQRYPSIAVDTLGRIFIVWRDMRQGDMGCFFALSDDGGLNFSNDIKVSDGGDLAIDRPSIAVDDSDGVYVAWGDDIRLMNGGERIYFAFSPSAGDSFLPNVRVDDLPPGDEYWLWSPTLAINEDKKVFIAWQDDRLNHTNAFDIYFASGSYVGIQEYVKSDVVKDFVEVLPNPFQRYLTVKSLQADITQIALFDVSGRQIKSKEINNGAAVKLDVQDLPGGIYFIKVKSKEKTFIKKVVKVK
ncbi:MAG: T9SS type A sorting domain-containing protein [bacterium]